MELKLYNYFRSSPSYRVRIALHMKGLEFEYKPIHLLKNGGEQHSPEYQKINPAREVPALAHEGQIITQSVAIIEYLDEVYPNPPLYPKEPGARARIRQYCETINCTHPLQNLKVLQYLEKEFSANDEKKTQWITNWMSQSFAALEELLHHTSGTYCWGDQITAADLFLIPQIFAGQRFSVPMDNFKTIHRINESCLKVEAFQKAHPYRQVDTPEEFLKK